MDSLKILYDHQIFSSQTQGGISRYFTELLRAWETSGIVFDGAWAFTANRYLQDWAPDRYRDWCPRLRFKGKAHVTYGLNQGVSRRHLRRSDWTLFHPTYYNPYFLSKLGGRPFVVTIHDMTHELYPQGLSDIGKTPKNKALVAHNAALVIAVSENTRQDAIRLLGLAPEKVVTVHHGNGLVPGAVEPEKPLLDKPYWLYVGSRGEYKNWALVVQALKTRNRKDDRLVMVGGGALTLAERAVLDQAGLSGSYLQTSATEAELAGWYAGAQALVYPSLYEGFGMPLLEAMAWGCPVVASRASSLPEIGGSAALYFDPKDSGDLVRVLGEVTDRTVRDRLVSAGWERQKPFTWEQTAGKTLEVYRKALETGAEK